MLPVDTFHQHSDFIVLRTLCYFKKYAVPYFEEVWQIDYKLYANKSLLYDNNHTPMQVASDLHLHVDLYHRSLTNILHISPLLNCRLYVDLSAKYFVVMQPQFGIGT